jgi:acyl-CoA ligase (AMP-forming) (exosortase A-associated)
VPICLHHLLSNSFNKSPDAIAICCKDNTYSYRQLFELVSQQSLALQALKLKPQQRVGIYLPKQIETVSSFLAVSQAGGIFVPINPVLKPLQVNHILCDCNVNILITSTSRLISLQESLADCADLQTIILVDTDSCEFHVNNLQILGWSEFVSYARGKFHSISSLLETDVATILYTSGSTGKPKGVVLSHRNMVAGAESVVEYLEISSHDRLLAVLPFSFDYGLNQLITTLMAGASCVLMDYLLPQDVIRALGHYRITGLAAVPSLWIQLADLTWPESIDTHLRYMTNSGGSMPIPVLQKLRSKAPKSRIFLMYGLTEAFRSTYLSPDQLDIRPNSLGKAIPNAELMVVKEDGGLCKPHEPGELVHRGPLVSLGYWNDPLKTAERFKPVPSQLSGLTFTEIAVWSGDTVTTDEEGYLYFIGRQDDLIKTSGYRVSPAEVEEVIYSSGLVKETVAIGVPHSQLGQAILIVVSLDENVSLNPQSLLDHCKLLLPNYMIPAEIKVMSELPRNPNGKIDRKLLSQMFASVFET